MSYKLIANMYNLHCHSLHSDGVLLPSEVAVRYLSAGYRTIAITDHADYSNADYIIKGVLAFCHRWPVKSGIKVLPGIELTHLDPSQFKPLARYCRSKGLKVIVAHGQTPVEPVLKGTNRMALEADIDILAHPGDISGEDSRLAQKNGVFLEITSRSGHSFSNTHVVKMAKQCGAKLILNTDSHAPEDIIHPEELVNVGLKAGLAPDDIKNMYADLEKFLSKKGG